MLHSIRKDVIFMKLLWLSNYETRRAYRYKEINAEEFFWEFRFMLILVGLILLVSIYALYRYFNRPHNVSVVVLSQNTKHSFSVKHNCPLTETLSQLGTECSLFWDRGLTLPFNPGERINCNLTLYCETTELRGVFLQ